MTNGIYLSSLFFWYYICFADCRNLNKREVYSFPCSIDEVKNKEKRILIDFSEKLQRNLQENSYFLDMKFQKYGLLKTQIFNPKLSKLIIDEIDKVLAQHYGFTDEELDFIVNYDIKYRMGGELEGEEWDDL